MSNTPPRPARAAIRFPGIVAAARELGVNRITLYRVLTGQWTHLPNLKRRYEALMAERSASTQS